MDCKFAVSFSKKHLFLTVPLFSLMAAGGINRCVRNNYMPTYIIAVVIVLAIMAADLLTTLCFSAKVYDTEIVYRTRLGIRHRLKLSDICSVKYEKDVGTKYGNKYYLYIITSTKPDKVFKANSDMRNFDLLSGFLLEKINSGEIQPAAVSPQCMDELKRYRNGICNTKPGKRSNKFRAAVYKESDEMFGAKNKGPKTVYSEVFGKMKRDGHRGEIYRKHKDEKFVLLNAKYEIPVYAVSGSEETPITPAQEASYRYFIEHRNEVLRQIEAAVEACPKFGSDTSEPSDLLFDLNGGFGMNFMDMEKLGVNDVDGAMFTVTVLPRVSVICGDFYWRKSTGVVK